MAGCFAMYLTDWLAVLDAPHPICPVFPQLSCPVLAKNMNALVVDQEVQEQRLKSKAEHERKKQKDKEDREKQKQAASDRKEAEKKRTQKGERRR